MQQNLPIVVSSDSLDSMSSEASIDSIFNYTLERPKLKRESKIHIMSNYEITNELMKMNNKIDKLLSLLTEKNK
tara:strand:- start:3381 stop:3602 length:222 start_codon:yes stop_codon:yes gene_type:complete